MIAKFSTLVAFASAFSSLTQAFPLDAREVSTNSTEELLAYAESGESGWTAPVFPHIHQSCNATNQRMINSALQDSLEVTAVAKERLLANGTDEIFQRWFGNGSIFTVLGVLDYAVEANKSEVIYRCDDPTGDCIKHADKWPGYHVENTTGETNLCDMFYKTKKPLSTICFDGNITDVGPKHYAGIDLIHRYFHLEPLSGDGYVGEYVETLPEALYLAEKNSTFAVRNTDNYLYYLADVYANAVNPGGCLGKLPKAEKA